MRTLATLVGALLIASSAMARDSAPFYGPKHGAFGEGYIENVEKDGSWRIVTEYRSGDPYLAVDVALYRAAELARELGQSYVQVLGGHGMSRYGAATGYVYMRPSERPEAPANCRDKQCYTADVAKVLDALSGPDGDQPGVVKPSSEDEYGRPVSYLGFGIGAIAWTNRH
jgi:hypothetical protein